MYVFWDNKTSSPNYTNQEHLLNPILPLKLNKKQCAGKQCKTEKLEFSAGGKEWMKVKEMLWEVMSQMLIIQKNIT